MLEQIVGEIEEAAAEKVLCGTVDLGLDDHTLALEVSCPFSSALFFMNFVGLLLQIRRNKRESLSSLI